MLQLQKPCRSFNLLGYICTFCRGVAACGLQRMLRYTQHFNLQTCKTLLGLCWAGSTVFTSASKRSIQRFAITEKAPTNSVLNVKAVVATFNQEKAL